jgi:hypothetical protein
LAAKNAILIVEFAKQLEDGGKSRFEAAVEAARLRLRPILMTSFAFIFASAPLVWAVGGRTASNARHGGVLRHDRGYRWIDFHPGVLRRDPLDCRTPEAAECETAERPAV